MKSRKAAIYEYKGDNCFPQIREKLQEDAKEICQWNGWHPIMRAHLEMFFGLKINVDYFKKEMEQ